MLFFIDSDGFPNDFTCLSHVEDFDRWAELEEMLKARGMKHTTTVLVSY